MTVGVEDRNDPGSSWRSADTFPFFFELSNFRCTLRNEVIYVIRLNGLRELLLAHRSAISL